MNQTRVIMKDQKISKKNQIAINVHIIVMKICKIMKIVRILTMTI